MEKDLIQNLKVAIFYGGKEVDGKKKDGKVEKIYKDEEDTAHIFYMLDFLKNNFKNETEIKKAIEKHDVNSIFYEISKLGHAVFAESTSTSRYKQGLYYLPRYISEKQKKSLEVFEEQLKDENYHVNAFYNLHRDEDGILLGNQREIQSIKDILNVVEVKNIDNPDNEINLNDSSEER